VEFFKRESTVRITHRRAHLRIWIALAVLLPLLFAVTAVLRRGQMVREAPIQLTPDGQGKLR